MAQLLVREVSEDTIRKLKGLAKVRGRSVEAEHRLIREAVVRPPLTTAEWAERIASTGIGELDPDELRDRQDTGREIDGL
jgi:plasmid stability protein